MQLFYMLNLFDYFFNGVVSIADLGLIILLIYVLLKQNRVYIRKYHLFLFVFWFVAGVSGLLNIISDSTFFDISLFVISYFKLSAYIVSFVILPPFFSHRLYKLKRVLINSLIIISLLGLYQFIAHNFFPNLPYSLVPETKWITSRGYEVMISYGGKFRVKSIFSEPAHFAIYTTLLYSYLIHHDISMSKRTHLLINTSIILSFSLSGIILLIFNYLLLTLKYYKNLKKFAIYLIVLLCISSFIIMTNDYVSNRFNRILELSEGSSTTRLIGAWEAAFNAPFYGIGLGHTDIFISNLRGELSFYKIGSGIANIFAVILTTTGYLGLIIFLMFLLYLNKYNILFCFFIIVSGFAWGQFNSIPFWIILNLIATSNLLQRFNKDLKRRLV